MELLLLLEDIKDTISNIEYKQLYQIRVILFYLHFQYNFIFYVGVSPQLKQPRRFQYKYILYRLESNVYKERPRPKTRAGVSPWVGLSLAQLAPAWPLPGPSLAQVPFRIYDSDITSIYRNKRLYNTLY